MNRWLHPFCCALALVLAPAAAQSHLTDLLEEPGLNLANDAARARVVERMAQIENDRRARARAKAAAAGLPLRAEINGRLMEIHSFDGPEPVYLTTDNVSAAISTGANPLQSSPYTLNGNGLTIGMWDGGSGRSTHQEFGGRMVVKDGSASIDHATHVGGTLIASGVVANAKGMATSAVVDSYDWNSDLSEMTSRGATGPGQQATRIYLSNHSYGYVSGWNNTGGTGTPARTWEWHGNGTTATSIEQDFGRYNTYSRDIDSLVFNSPYYLIFQSAGNDRTDNPSAGQTVALSPGSTTVVAYDPTLHPGGDGKYHSGFESIAFRALAKNIVTVGSVNDAVTSGTRDPAKGTMSSFSCWGPTDDGRIKPDLVANGAGLYSSLNSSDSSYGSYSGTSMSSPNACGSASLLVQQYSQLFSGGAMRAATLKGLLIHSATDLGNPGPDYKNGWGLMDVKTAADLIADHHANPLKQRLTESQLTTSITTLNYPFVWDGIGPIRATLCWTDPAGTATTTSDLRSPRLVNNLELKLIAPDGSEHFPFVMPFVGTWTQESMDLPATTGINNTDNLEQVLVSSPGITGTWQAVVTYSGTLANNAQQFSLLLDGSAAEEPPLPPVALSSISPTSGLSGSLVSVVVKGTSLGADTVVKLTKSGQADILPLSQSVNGADLSCQFDLEGAATGAWSVVATNPDASTSTLADAFTVIGSIWSENFDATGFDPAVEGWASIAERGSNSWALVTTNSHTPAISYFAPAPSFQTTTNLVSPAIPIPQGSSNLQLKFWHQYSLGITSDDAGCLELSINGGAWFDAGFVGSGTSFASNGYTSTLRSNARSDLAGRDVWKGTSAGFIETILNLTDNAKFEGNTLQMRWRLATDNRFSSTGWYVDSIALIGDGNLANQPPAITSAATSSSTETVTDTDTSVWRIERGTSTTLSVAASDDGGAGGLTYTWNISGSAPVLVSPNSSNSASTATAEFEQTGDYIATVTVTDEEGLAAASSVNLRVVQTASGLVVSPAVASLTVGQTLSFSALLNDQFGTPLDSQPGSFAWSAAGGGTIDASGLFTATSAGGPFAITASSGGFSDFASVTVNPIPATITLDNLNQTYDGTPHVATATTDPPGLAYEITYDGVSTAPTEAGSYAVLATITAPNYQGGDSDILVIEKAAASVVLSNLVQTYDSTPKAVTVTTDPPGLAVETTYNGSTSAPVEVGEYAVVATVTDPNHQGSANDTLVIEALNDFTAWQNDHFTGQQILDGLADAMADPEMDGLCNFAEFALGTDPWEFTPLPSATKDADGLTLTFTRPTGLVGVAYAAESSTDMETWSPVTLEVIGSAGGVETVRARDPLSDGDASRRFMRLRFTRE